MLAGLRQPQKAIPARWLYDDAGSQLFEDITQLPEYYPTRSEREILENSGDEFAAAIGAGRAVVEFGSGSSVKTPLLLKAIAPSSLRAVGHCRGFPARCCCGFAGQVSCAADPSRRGRLYASGGAARRSRGMPKLGFFPGSTIGNMVPRTAVDLLRTMRETLGEKSKLLIGMDLIKDHGILEAAYDDAAGVTAEFNLNLARRINRELRGTIPIDALSHEARWNDDFARVEMHLVAQFAT